jgi:transposase
MGTSNCSGEFKRDAVQQITVRGYPVREVSRGLGVSSHSLYKWIKLFAVPAAKAPGLDHEAQNRRLKQELTRVTEERDILEKQRRTSRASPNSVRLHLGASDRVRLQALAPGDTSSLQRLPCGA